MLCDEHVSDSNICVEDETQSTDENKGGKLELPNNTSKSRLFKSHKKFNKLEHNVLIFTHLT